MTESHMYSQRPVSVLDSWSEMGHVDESRWKLDLLIIGALRMIAYAFVYPLTDLPKAYIAKRILLYLSPWQNVP